MPRLSKINFARSVEENTPVLVNNVDMNLNIEEIAKRLEKSPSIKVIGSARNVEEVPRVARMIKRLSKTLETNQR